MRTIHLLIAVGALALNAHSQDKVTLSNGDVVTGKVVSMAEGKVTVQSPLLGEVVVAKH